MKKALVVDDEKELASVLVLRLAAAGLEAEAAHDGIRALERARTTVPDVVITDVSMPGLDGWSLCEALRGDIRTRGAWLVVMTAWKEPQLEKRAKEVGATLVLKPFDERRLARLVAGSGGVSTAQLEEPE